MLQLKLCGPKSDPNAPLKMDVALADFLHSHCLPFSLAEDPKLIQLIQVARTLGPNYKPPGRDLISGKYLDAIYETSWKEQMSSLLSEARIYGVTVFGDGATIKSVALVNVLAAGVNNPFALLDIADCTGHLAHGGKKDAKYIANLVKPLITQMESEVDVHNKRCHGIVDLVLFDGASNVQNAGTILQTFNPRITVGHGAEHVVSLFFSDVYLKVPQFQQLSEFGKKLRNIFGSVRHTPKAIFETHSRKHNHGIYLGFIKPSECRMAGEHIALLRLLRLKNALRSTITSMEWINLNMFHSDCAILMNPDFWKLLFVMCRALYAPMRVLRLADQKTPAMDKLYYYVLQTDRMLPIYLQEAEDLCKQFLTNETLSAMDRPSTAGLSLLAGTPDDSEEADDEYQLDGTNFIDGTEHDDTDSDSDDDIDGCDADDEDAGIGLKSTILQFWRKRRTKLIHDYSLVGYILSPNPTIMEHAITNKGQIHDDAVERLISKLLLDPSLVGSAKNTQRAYLIDTFMEEYGDFTNRRGLFSRDNIWIIAADDATKSYKWHYKYSYHQTKVLGKLACLVLSKILRIGTAERNWKQVKAVKSGQRVNTTIDRTKKQVLVYAQYQQMRAQAHQKKLSSAGKLWDDNDFASMKMDQYCREIRDSLLESIDDEEEQQPMRIVRLWEETWERKKLPPRGDVLHEARLLAKYKGLKFFDADNDNRIMTIHKMAFRKERGRNRYDIFAIMDGFNLELPDQCEENDPYWQPWEVNEDLFDCIRAYYNDVPTDNIKTYDIGEGCESDNELL
jgi:hypothetical protein